MKAGGMVSYIFGFMKPIEKKVEVPWITGWKPSKR
jgi:hypothetical protein